MDMTTSFQTTKLPRNLKRKARKMTQLALVPDSTPVLPPAPVVAAPPPEPPPAQTQPPPPPTPPVEPLAPVDDPKATAPMPPPAPVTAPATDATDAPAAVDPTLATILAWKRPFDTKPEYEFMSWLHAEIKKRGHDFRIAGRGNVIVEIPRPDKKKTGVMFSCHTDTVHDAKDAAVQQALLYDSNFGHIFLDRQDKTAGSCLGADDGAGVWIMLEMIKANKPGVYVFHRGEERGGQGAESLRLTHSQWLEEFDIAVAFDRRDVDEVITHQGGLRTCSDKFANALAKALNAADPTFKYRPSAGGTFTDTKVYYKLISECSNISVGYAEQHTKFETLDFGHLCKLRDAAVKIDWDALPADRDPKAVDAYMGSMAGEGGWGGFDAMYGYGRASRWDDDGFDHLRRKYAAPTKKGRHGAKPKVEPTAAAKPVAPPPRAPNEPVLQPEDHFRGAKLEDISSYLESNPDEAALLVLELAAETASLRAALNFYKGAV